MRRAALAAAVLGLAAGGCTDLRVSGLGAASTSQLPAGFIYNLPAATVTPSASLRLKSCTVDDDTTAALRRIDKTAPEAVSEIEFALSGDFAVEQVAGKPVLIDYRQLADFLKTSSVGIERHPNGMLKSVNVAVEDQSPELIASIAVIAADVALLSTGAGAGFTAAAAGFGAVAFSSSGGPKALAHWKAIEPPVAIHYTACKPKTLEKLAERKTQAAARALAKGSLVAKTAALETLKRNADTGFTKAELKAYHSLRDDMLALADEIDAATAAIAEIDDALSIPLDADAATDILAQLQATDGVVLTIPEAKRTAFVARWLFDASVAVPAATAAGFGKRACTKVEHETCTGIGAVGTAVAALARATATAKVDRLPVDGMTPVFKPVDCSTAGAPGCPIEASRGIVYVEPARVTLKLTAPDLGPDAVAGSRSMLKTVKASVPQLGIYLALPVHAGFGEKVALAATFATDGSLVSGSFGRPSAAGKAIAGTVAGVLDTAVASREAREARRLKLQEDKVKQLNALQAALDAADKAKPKAADPKADQAAELAADLAIANAKASLAEAALREAQANAKLGGGG